MPAAEAEEPLEIEHIIPRKHGGASVGENLALPCAQCNGFKGPNLTGILANGAIVRLFHPRTDRWEEHFAWNGAVIVPRTNVAQATVLVLRLNHVRRVGTRAMLMEAGLW